MRVADIPSERLNLLNTGQAESTTLTECLAVDFAGLMRATFPDIGQERLSAMQAASGAGITRRMALAAKLIHDAYPQGMVAALCEHKSDTLRGWACYLIAEQEDMPLRTRLMSMRCLADDAHFGVREWAWLARLWPWPRWNKGVGASRAGPGPGPRAPGPRPGLWAPAPGPGPGP